MKKVAIVTGCAKGIGRSIALGLAQNGYNIIGTYNTSLNDIQNLKFKIDQMGVNFDYYKLDISNENEINTFYNNIKNKYQSIDVLVNNAALSLDNEFSLKSKEEFMKVLEVNLVGPFLLIQRFSKIMNKGVIVNISSTDGINTYSKLSMDYSASKAGLINLTKSLALELENIKIYALCPNWVNTESIREMNPEYLEQEMKRINQKTLIEPADVAKKLMYMIYSDLKSGSIVVMEG